MEGIIYRAYNSEGKSYIGQTVKTLEQRKYGHWSNRKDGKAFHNALLDKGLDAFKWEVLEDNIPEDELNDREIYWIDKFNSYENGYNSDRGGHLVPRKITVNNKNALGKKWKLDDDTKAAMKKPKSEEHKKNISKGQKGIPKSEETRKKMSIAAKKRCTKERMSEIGKMKHGIAPGNKNKHRVYTPDGKYHYE